MVNLKTIVAKEKATPAVLRRTALFYLLAFAFSWTIWIALILYPPLYSEFLLILGSFGPIVAAICTNAIFGGRPALGRWLRQTFRWRMSLRWYLAGWLLLPLLFMSIQLALYLLFVGPVTLNNAGELPWYYVAAIFPLNVLLAAPIGSGMGEEPGWQGFALPGLVASFHPLIATVIHGILWGAWHLPAFTSAWGGSSQPLGWFFAYLIPLSMIMFWLTRKAGGSVIPAILLHSATNLYSSLFAGEMIFVGSLALHFTEFKTMAYWSVALVLILATRGRLGAGATNQLSPNRPAAA